MKILILDNDAEFRNVLSRYFSWYGFDVESFAQGYHIFSRAENADYNLVICNAWQEPEDGFLIVERIRKSNNEHIKRLNILMTSPEPLDHKNFKWLRNNEIYFMAKYQSPERWYEKVNTILSKTTVEIVQEY